MELWHFGCKNWPGLLLTAVVLVWSNPTNAEPTNVPAVSSANSEDVARRDGAGALEAPAPVAASVEKDAVAARFATTCAGCHTIGGGASRGPDLAGVTAWPESQLKLAIKSMERKVGPLSDAQIEMLAGLLKDARARERVAKATSAISQRTESPIEPANSLVGGALFFGQSALTNGGMACFACHRFNGQGGDLAPDLTRFAQNGDIESLAGTIGRASFPLMRGAYAAHPITSREARDLAAFLKHAQRPRAAAALAQTSSLGIAAGLGAFTLALGLILIRPKGVRARLVRRASKR
ncbi:MAG TPA: c-type cytochrome [Polyangiaceae bacterium]|nr:c-type cytochrome [Polyangiaceae bacterium]